MLDVKHLCFDYDDKSLLHNIEFNLDSGCMLHLRGSNGAGKTTLLKLLAGMLKPHCGEIYYQQQPIVRDISAYQRMLCYVGHKAGISQLLTVRENCYFSLQRTINVTAFDELLVRFALSELDDVPCGVLSAGQRRRVGLLKLMMSDATLWLLDEPLVALDQHAIELLMECFKEHLLSGGQIVVTSHQTIPLSDMPYQEYCL